MALDVPPGIQLRGSNIKVDLVADDIDVFNGIINDVKSTSPVIIEEEVSVRNLVSSTHYLFIILRHIISFVHKPYYFQLLRQDWRRMI